MVIDTKIDYGGYGYGDGVGYGVCYGGGDGYGDGYGVGYGDGYGGGEGYGDGVGHGDGYGHGDSYVYVHGDGYGQGCGYGHGDSFGGGDGYGELVYPESAAFLAYHYIKKTKHGFVMRNGTVIQPGQVCEEPKIEMCKIGLHSSMTPVEAKKYAPDDSVLTQVKVWGRVIFSKDKLVSTHRKLIEERK